MSVWHTTVYIIWEYKFILSFVCYQTYIKNLSEQNYITPKNNYITIILYYFMVLKFSTFLMKLSNNKLKKKIQLNSFK